jgi:tetratricopeptide (TPR) repeat protein
VSNQDEFTSEPSTPEELLAFHELLRRDPERYLRIVNGWLKDDPKNVDAYFSRHQGWMEVGEPQRALDDLKTVAELDAKPDAMFLMARAAVYRHVGEYEKALADYNQAGALDPKAWETDIVFGLLFQADTYARLGDEGHALSTCARLPEDFWTPGIRGAPGGDKTEVADKLRAVAAAARRTRG